MNDLRLEGRPTAWLNAYRRYCRPLWCELPEEE